MKHDVFFCFNMCMEYVRMCVFYVLTLRYLHQGHCSKDIHTERLELAQTTRCVAFS